MTTPTGPAALFDDLASDYDQSGVEFFGPIASRLLASVPMEAGMRVADLGSGRGAVALRAAQIVGPTGTVSALDLAPAMVDLLATDAADLGLGQLSAAVGDVAAPALTLGSYDVVTSSAVLFFLPDPVLAVRRWLALLRPAGWLAIATFGDVDPVWARIDQALGAFGPADSDDGPSPFESDAGVDALLVAAGGVDVRSECSDLPVVFRDAAEFHAWTMTTTMRQLWRAVPAPDLASLRARIDDLLAEATGSDGTITLHQSVRITTARRG